MGCAKSRPQNPNRVHPDLNQMSSAHGKRSRRELRRIANMFRAECKPVVPSILECDSASPEISAAEPEVPAPSGKTPSKEVITDKFVTTDRMHILTPRACLSDEDEGDNVLRVWYRSESPQPPSFKDDDDVGDLIRAFWTRSYCNTSEGDHKDTAYKYIVVRFSANYNN